MNFRGLSYLRRNRATLVELEVKVKDGNKAARWGKYTLNVIHKTKTVSRSKNVSELFAFKEKFRLWLWFSCSSRQLKGDQTARLQRND